MEDISSRQPQHNLLQMNLKLDVESNFYEQTETKLSLNLAMKDPGVRPRYSVTD